MNQLEAAIRDAKLVAAALGYEYLSFNSHCDWKNPYFGGMGTYELNLRDPNTQKVFTWSPVFSPADRYALIKRLRMTVDFSGEMGEVSLPPPESIPVPLKKQFDMADDFAEGLAVMRLAYIWAINQPVK